MSRQSAFPTVLNRFSIAGHFAWVLGCTTTANLIHALTIPWLLAVPLAVLLQYILTSLEAPFVMGDRDFAGFVAFVVDVLINASSLIVFLMFLSHTDFWVLVLFLTGKPIPNDPSLLSISDIDGPGRFLISVITFGLGVLLAVAPEVSYRRARRYKYGIHSGTKVQHREKEIIEEVDVPRQQQQQLAVPKVAQQPKNQQPSRKDDSPPEEFVESPPERRRKGV
jgi:hypothetical protein